MEPRSVRTHPTDDPAPATLEACRRGDRKALETVLRAHAPALEQLLARLAGPRADTEDLLQETFVAAIRAFPRFRGQAAVHTWLTRIAVHVAQDHLRRGVRERRRLELVRDGTATATSSGVGPARVAEARGGLERAYGHLDNLSPRRRVAFVLHVIEGRSIEEVASLLGTSVTAAKSRVFWAQRKLLRRMRHDPVLRELLHEPSGGGT